LILALALAACGDAGRGADAVPDDTDSDVVRANQFETQVDGADLLEDQLATDVAEDVDAADEVEVQPPAIAVLAVAPPLADSDGGGGRVVIAVDRSAGAMGATLGGVPVSAFAIDDATHVSGVPGAHVAGVVDVVVTGGETASTGGAGRFEYWTPAQIAELDVYLDAGRGVSEDAGRVVAWHDQGPNRRVFEQANPALRPKSGAAVHFEAGQFVRLAAPVEHPAGVSVFAIAAWSATTADVAGQANGANVPLTIVGDMTSGYGAFGAAGGAVVSNHYVGGPVYTARGEALNDGQLRLIGATWDAQVVARIFLGNIQIGLDGNSAALAGANALDAIGAGIGRTGSGDASGDAFEGDLATVVIVSGEITVADRTRLDHWATQRWGTPVSAPLDPWQRTTLGELPTTPDEWHPRDGAQMVQLGSGRVLLLGGWNPRDFWGPGGDQHLGERVTNEVWASDDAGVSWRLLLPHDAAAERYPPGHTVGVTTFAGHAVVFGTDCLRPPLLGEVWHSNEDGTAWTRVATDAPAVGRCLFMVGKLGDDIYMMGGQRNLYDPASGIADVWRSRDGGVTWSELARPPWAARGMVFRPAEQDGRLYVIGGGLYADADMPAVAFNGVYAFDGATWTTVLPDGHAQWQASYYNAAAALGGRLWLFNGFTGVDELSRTLVSDDAGLTWRTLPGGSGGEASHADAVVALSDRILRISGNLSERRVYAFSRR